MAAAKAMTEHVGQRGAKSGECSVPIACTVPIADSKAVQVGDGNIQINRF